MKNILWKSHMKGESYGVERNFQ